MLADDSEPVNTWAEIQGLCQYRSYWETLLSVPPGPKVYRKDTKLPVFVPSPALSFHGRDLPP